MLAKQRRRPERLGSARLHGIADRTDCSARRRNFDDLFCTFFTWQSWLLLLEAIDDGRVTDSAWAPPLWIPYSLMTAGMSLLTLRLVMQLGQAFGGKRSARA